MAGSTRVGPGVVVGAAIITSVAAVAAVMKATCSRWSPGPGPRTSSSITLPRPASTLTNTRTFLSGEPLILILLSGTGMYVLIDSFRLAVSRIPGSVSFCRIRILLGGLPLKMKFPELICNNLQYFESRSVPFASLFDGLLKREAPVIGTAGSVDIRPTMFLDLYEQRP